MQPPPRKVKHTTALKNIHAEQVAKLQAKHQQECDLLEDIRNFARQRSIIEKEYAQSLLKLTTGLLKRDFPATPDLSTDDGQEHRTALGVWRVILEETESLAKAKLQAAEIYTEKIAEPIKPLRANKIQCQKKVMPQLTTVHQEVSQSVMEMAKSQKGYNLDENVSHEARLKAADSNDRLARRSTGIFQSLTSLQQKSAKLNSRRDMCEAKSCQSRNEYVLNMSAANAHQIRYYSIDLPEVMKTLDGEMFEQVKDYFDVLGSTALDVSSREKDSCENIVSQAKMIDRQFNHQCFLYCNHVFTDLTQYHFEPCQNDECNKVSKAHDAGLQLDKEARKWATKAAKESKTIKEYTANIKSLQEQSQGDKLSDSGMDINSQQEVEQRIEEVRFCLRKSEIAKCKAEARLEALRQAEVNVDEWIASAQAESLRVEEEEMSRTPSQISLRTESSGGKSDDHEPTYTHYDDDDDFIDDTFEVSKHDSISSYGSQTKSVKCRAMYDFQASNADELDMNENDILEIISDGDGDGWLRARNSDGKVGYIPQNYIEVQENGGMDQSDHVDNTTPAEPTEGVEIHPIPSFDLQSPNDATQEVTSYSSGDIEVQMTTNQMSPDKLPVAPEEGIWARALYDYEAMTDEELSFTEGTLINIIRKDENGVDDGFWEGEINGKFGVFPSLVVEEIDTSLGGLNLLPSPDDRLGPPEFVPPPPVTITAATPETEDLPRALPNGTDGAPVSSSPQKTTEQYYRRVRQNKSQGRHAYINSHSPQPQPSGGHGPPHSRGVVSAARVSGHVPAQVCVSRQVGGSQLAYMDYDDEEGEVSIV
ncbi:F-BAR and double SH3 domains protein 2-like isoform X2 [Mizuhopecten yessoensis]|uniref:FCH and double SH3 domains protein 2 n=1 Tax=Mizuhopecten yessoensis TaxID=6573 RepID=A0A210PLA7_MIZYE|nr:F-BAR and double SH3 domains protein 2-like isoform X2 [Mizuhopecten yessoensis]OWF37271.1 FCH and double SH3 domains protein 2 [Mizuhopecten yessoensis]